MKLSDVIDTFISGDWGNEHRTKETCNAVFCVRGADIVFIEQSIFSNIPQRYISDNSFKSKLLQEGDIIIEKSGGSPTQATGRVVYISKELIASKQYIVCSNFCVAFRVKKQWDAYFIYQYWQYIYNNGVFFNFEGKTSGIKNLQLDIALSTLEIKPYPIEEQRFITSILTSLNTKITLNRVINHNLEAMAKQLYDYWFVQFDFPNEEGKPYKSSGGKMVWNEKLKREIPEGWEVLNIFKALEVQYGFPFATELFTEEETTIPIVRIRDIISNTISAYTTEVVDTKYLLHPQDLLIGMDGNFHINYWNDDKSFLNQRSVRIRAKKDGNVSIIQARYDIEPYIKAKELRTKGSTVGHLSDKDLKELYVTIPSNDYLKLRLDSILSKIISNRIEISTLTKQRDELLPLLMNGQVSINYDLSMILKIFYKLKVLLLQFRSFLLNLELRFFCLEPV